MITEAQFITTLKRHPLFKDGCSTYFRSSNSSVYLGGHVGDWWDGTRLACQIEGDLFYLLEIEVALTYRGQGLGLVLYQLAEELARLAGCQCIEMTPSGWTPSGEHRGDYLVRKLGYCLKRGIAVKEIEDAARQEAS